MHHRFAAVLVVLLLVTIASPAAAVTEDDVQHAADELAAARARAAEAVAARDAARAELADLRSRLEGLVDSMAATDREIGAARAAARDRLPELYMTSGRSPIVLVSDPSDLIRIVYAAAVTARGRELVARLEGEKADAAHIRELIAVEVARFESVAGDLEASAATVAALVGEAEARYREAAAAWQRQQAAAATATTAAPTTTDASEIGVTAPTEATPDPSTTTIATTVPAVTSSTTLPPDPGEGGPFPPEVERWRPLVADWFPSGLVDDALAIIACESLGDPAITNPVSGAAGLFQHIPLYWPERADAIGMPDASPYDPEANIAAAAWLVATSLDVGLPPWYFWSCQP